MSDASPVTIPALHQMKRDGRKIVGVVAWDYQIARIVDRSPEARIQQIAIAVAPEEGGPGRAALTVFRRAPG